LGEKKTFPAAKGGHFIEKESVEGGFMGLKIQRLVASNGQRRKRKETPDIPKNPLEGFQREGGKTFLHEKSLPGPKRRADSF